jgi:hypothetical protein
MSVRTERPAAQRMHNDAWSPRDNAKFTEVKVTIRRNVLTALTPGRAAVFDAFAGTGEMWRLVWREAQSYVGCDEAWHNDERRCFVGDNRRVMRAIDLAPFTCFDFDAYGSPWDQLTILAARRSLLPGERIGLTITEGTWLKTRAKDPVRGLREALPARMVTPIPYGVHDELIARALRRLVGRMGGEVVKVWSAIGSTGAKVRYIGVVVESVVARGTRRAGHGHGAARGARARGLAGA